MRDPVKHDYRRRHWGHDFTFTPLEDGLSGKMHGWGLGIDEGDFLLLPTPNGGSTRYRVMVIRYETNPPDMWHATVRFDPRPRIS